MPSVCVCVGGEYLHACSHMHVFLFNLNLFSCMTDNYEFFYEAYAIRDHPSSCSP